MSTVGLLFHFYSSTYFAGSLLLSYGTILFVASLDILLPFLRHEGQFDYQIISQCKTVRKMNELIILSLEIILFLFATHSFIVCHSISNLTVVVLRYAI